MTAKLQPDIEAVASDFYDLEELVTEQLHEIHKTYGPDTLRDIADRLKHSIDIDVEIAIGAARAGNSTSPPERFPRAPS